MRRHVRNHHAREERLTIRTPYAEGSDTCSPSTVATTSLTAVQLEVTEASPIADDIQSSLSTRALLDTSSYGELPIAGASTQSRGSDDACTDVPRTGGGESGLVQQVDDAWGRRNAAIAMFYRLARER